MKESKFIEQNKQNWQEFEKDLRYKQNKATRLSRLFIQITDDLSYARTFYKYRSVKIFLNGIAQSLFNDLYRNQPRNIKGFVKFWKSDLPLQIHDARKEFRISFVVFLLAFCIGILSSVYDKDFARLILGNEYVNMTTENIKKHDPLAVYKQGNETGMFFGITINNLRVALITFVFGLILSIGTIVSLIYNGIMVGAFQYFFIERGLFRESFLTIWQHGTLEISTIIIAGAAGITLGKGLLFPGTYSRLESFKISASRGLKILFGITPIIIFAAFIEGFFTRYTNANDLIRLIVIVLSLAFVLFYFVWYPWVLSKRQTAVQKKEIISYRKSSDFNFAGILTAETILGYSFKFISQHILWVTLLISGLAASHGILSVVNEFVKPNFDSSVGQAVSLFFQIDHIQTHFFLGIVTLTILLCLICIKSDKLVNHEVIKKKKFLGILNLIFSSAVISFLCLVPFAGGIYWGLISLVFFAPFALLTMFHGYKENKFFILAIPATLNLLNGSWGKMVWNSIKIFLLAIIFFILLRMPFIWSYIEGLFMNFNDAEVINLIKEFVVTFIVLLLFSTYFVFQMSTAVFNYFAFKETRYAENLHKRIEGFGERKIMFGFEKENTGV